MTQTFKIGSLPTLNRLGFGTMRATTGEGVWGDPSDKKAAIRILQQAIETGVNFIDTADAYGPGNSEAIIAEALHPYRDIVVATKGGSVKYAPGKVYANGHPEYLKNAAEQSIKRLKVEAIDLYYLHRPDPEVPFEDSVGALKDLQDAGKIKHIGISNVTLEQAQKALEVADIAAIQHSYNLLNRKNDALLEFCEQNGLAFVAYYPTTNFGANETHPVFEQMKTFAKELNVSLPQLSLAWLLHRSEHILPIPGTSSEAHLRENMRTGSIDLSGLPWTQEFTTKGFDHFS
jgi:pyridoxine 4-dehydrogenase